MTGVEGLDQVTVLATDTATSAWNAASDVLILLVLAGTLFLFAYYVGKGQFVAIMLALYGAFAIYTVFPFKSLLPTAPALTALLAQAGLFIAISSVFYVILRRMVVSDFLYVGIIGLVILSLLGAAFLIALANHTFMVSAVYQFTPTITKFITPDEYFFWWFIAPAVGLFFLAR
jgi:hypothetical protein